MGREERKEKRGVGGDTSLGLDIKRQNNNNKSQEICAKWVAGEMSADALMARL